MNQTGQDDARSKTAGKGTTSRPTPAQARYLELGLGQAGGKLPLFDRDGQEIPARTIRSCVEKGWAEPWFDNPIKPDWLVCRLTDDGRRAVEGGKPAN